MGQRVGLLIGGWGEEREISLRTGEGVATALRSRGHRVTTIVAGPGLERTLFADQVDVVFIGLHGPMGEDGKVQGLLEIIGIPYTGSGLLASALAMNKSFAKKLFRHHNLPTPAWYSVRREQIDFAVNSHRDFGFPCMVKPVNSGSSIGVSTVQSFGELATALALACRFGGEALVERNVRGQEITVGILDDSVLGSCEIEHSGQLFDYRRKYVDGASYHLPPRLSPARLASIEALAMAAYRSLGCRGYARVDLIASERDNDQLLEVNTLPGLTRKSLLPKIGVSVGIRFDELIERILLLASCDAVRGQAPSTPAPQELTGTAG